MNLFIQFEDHGEFDAEPSFVFVFPDVDLEFSDLARFRATMTPTVDMPPAITQSVISN